MKALTLCSRGFEEENAKEILEIIGSKAKSTKQRNIFDFKNYDDLAKLCYFTQTSEKVLVLIDEQPLDKIDNLKITPDKTLLKETFAVRSIRLNDYKDLSKEFGAKIFEKFKLKVDLERPDTLFILLITEDTAYLTIDFCQRDLSKRDYRIFTHTQALKATNAACLLYVVDAKADSVIVDPFSGSGTIPIEAALKLGHFSSFFYSKDQLRFPIEFDLEELDDPSKDKLKIYAYDIHPNSVNATKKNAKIAGINKKMNISKIDAEWLDTKFDKESVDYIITHPPNSTKFMQPSELKKLYKEFFYQSEFIIKKSGKILLVAQTTDLLKESAKNYKFKIVLEREVWQGQQNMFVLVLERSD
jgi:23S rRNA G2445 N2-methylase RlmL